MIEDDVKEILALLKKQEEERIIKAKDKRAETQFNIIIVIAFIIVLGIIAIGC